MKTSIRNTLFVIAALTTVASSSAMATGWDFSNYKGFGGWRTFDHQDNYRQDSSGDEGYAVKHLDLYQCQQRCSDNLNEHGQAMAKDHHGNPIHQCQGIEYVKNQYYDHYHQPYYETTCEIHWDKFAWCDTRGGTKTTHGEDGCWIKPSNYVPPYQTLPGTWPTY